MMNETSFPNLVRRPRSQPPPWPQLEEDVRVVVEEMAPRAAVDDIENPSGETTADGLVRLIEGLDAWSSRCESDDVARTIKKGGLLGKLKSTAKRDWGARLETLKIAPRVVGRLVRIGRWGQQIGLNESELLDRLPRDQLKLEWLTKLDRDQLRELFTRIDCRQLDRPAVIKAVKQILGQQKPAAEGDHTLKTIERLIKRLETALDGLGTPSSTEARRRLRTVLDTAIADLF